MPKVFNNVLSFGPTPFSNSRLSGMTGFGAGFAAAFGFGAALGSAATAAFGFAAAFGSAFGAAFALAGVALGVFSSAKK